MLPNLSVYLSINLPIDQPTVLLKLQKQTLISKVPRLSNMEVKRATIFEFLKSVFVRNSVLIPNGTV